MAMLFGDLDELGADVEVDGEVVRRTKLLRIYEHRGWATVLIVHEDRSRDGQRWQPKASLWRLRRAGEGWRRHAQLSLPADQVVAIVGALTEHLALFGAEPAPDVECDDDDDEAAAPRRGPRR